MVDHADGINVACDRACFTASIPILRSLWEGTLSMEYMLLEDFEDRSTAWMAVSYMRTKSSLSSLDPSTDKGKAVQSLKAKDKIHQYVPFPNSSSKEVQEAMASAEQELRKEKFKTAIQKLTDSNGKLMRWFAINNGPRNLEQLAHHLGRPLEYEFLYRYFSEISHAQNASRIFENRRGTFYISQMRGRADAETVYLTTSSCLIHSSELIGKKLRPGEDTISKIREIVGRHRPEALAQHPQR